jgi:phospholipid-binding lipoprotein MlaA
MRPRRDPARRLRLTALAVGVAALAAGVAWADADTDGGAGDPWETMNRVIFGFNERADHWVIVPIAKGMDFVIPDPAERSIRRFFENSMFPIRFLNDLLQCKPVSAVEDLARFAVNATIGVAGFFDPATHLGLEGYREDFGQTLGYWGIPTGPYLVLPFLGPSSARDTVGLAGDSAALVYPYFLPFWVSRTITLGGLLNWRSLKLDEIAAEREAALDYYVAVRNAYVSFRENEVWDSEEDELDGDDLYYLD